MTTVENKVQKLLEKSKEVFRDCLLHNGCLVAAPAQMPYYPKAAKNYFYSWPGRDVGFSLTGALLLGIDAYEPVLTWLWERAENFRRAPDHLKFSEGLILQSYSPNGPVHQGAFQPDQNGTLLWAISEYAKSHRLTELMRRISQKLAEGLLKHWNGSHFTLPTQDLWEERNAHPNFQINLTYSLAATSCGLSWAGQYFQEKSFSEAAQKMKKIIEEKAYSPEAGHFLRRFGGHLEPSLGIDASMLGLIWPFSIIDTPDPRIVKTVETVEKKLSTPLGVRRYEFDEYEGETEMGWYHFKQGAGAWPLLNFWLAIVLKRLSQEEKSQAIFAKSINQIGEDLLIPEQVFPPKDPRIGVKPLLWAHMMFTHAAHELGYLSN